MNAYRTKFYEDYYRDEELLDELGLKNESTVKALAEKHKQRIKDFALNRLDTVKSLIVCENIFDLKEMLAYSPAGDGYGKDNYFIDFSCENDDESIDIQDIIVLIAMFNSILNKNGKSN